MPRDTGVGVLFAGAKFVVQHLEGLRGAHVLAPPRHGISEIVDGFRRQLALGQVQGNGVAVALRQLVVDIELVVHIGCHLIARLLTQKGSDPELQPHGFQVVYV
ncbi:hypothetical protein D3C85_1652370 [compost metagenome]